MFVHEYDLGHMHHVRGSAKLRERTAMGNARRNPDSASLLQKSSTWLRAYRKGVSLPSYSQLLSEGAVHQHAECLMIQTSQGDEARAVFKTKAHGNSGAILT